MLQYTTRGRHTITQNMYTTSTYGTSIVVLLDIILNDLDK